MTEQQKTIIAAVVLVIIVGVVFSANFRPKPKAAPAAAVRKVDANPMPDRRTLDEFLVYANTAAEADDPASWGPRNPFESRVRNQLPAVTDPKAPPSERKVYNLTGIVLGGMRPSAIINDIMVGEGGEIDGMVVKEIKEGEVVLSNGYADQVLYMRQ